MAVQSLKSLFPKLVGKYGDDLAEGLVKYGDEASDWAKGAVKRPDLIDFKVLRYDSPSPEFDIDSVHNFVSGFPIAYEKPWWSYDGINYDVGGGLSQLVPFSKNPTYSQSSKGGSGKSLKELMPKLFKNVSDEDLPF